ncbi:MAG: mandelate racemase/muconate lactonizing enzyme family protein [Halobacteriales archaeon]
MEITGVETTVLRLPIGRTVGDSRLSITDVYWIVVELETDTDHVGTGWMASLGFAPDLLARFVDQFEEVVVGRDPFGTEALARDMRARTIYYGELGMSAWPRAAIDVACWDLKGKAAGEPLYKLLGGDDPRVRAYASSMDATRDREELPELHGQYAGEGFTAFKTKVGDNAPEREAERVRAVREAVGEDADIFVDANQAWTVKEAIDVVERMDRHDVGWVEEPISEFDLAGHRRVADRIGPPLATGEMFYRPERFEWLLERGGMEVAQPDLVRAGGVSGQMEAARLAHRHGVPFCSHFYYAVSAHVVAAAPNGWLVEYIPEYDVAPILEAPPLIEDGHVEVPDRPGHGYAVDPAAREEYAVAVE